MANLVVCEICKKPYKSLISHVKTHSMSWVEYSKEYKVPEEYLEFIEEQIKSGKIKEEALTAKPKTTVNKKEAEKKIFKPKKEIVTLHQFLEDVEMKESELRALINTYKKGDPLPVNLQQKAVIATAEREAERKSKFESLKIQDLNIAEILVDKYGFIVETVKQATSRRPKEWILRKQK